MPKQTGKSSLIDKIGRATLETAHREHKDDQTEVFGGRLPPGISNGIAQVVDCRFDTFKSGDNAGEYFFIARASVKKPTEHGGVPIGGMNTMIGPEPVCETPRLTRRTVSEHIKWIYNELRKLGVDTSGLDPKDLESTAAAVAKAAPFIRFETRLGKVTPQYPNPRTFESWLGIVRDYQDDGEAGETVDETQPVDDEDKGGGESSPEAPSDTEDADLASLGELADSNDEVAQRELTGRAKLCNLDVEQYETWADVATAIAESPTESPKDEEETEPEEIMPSVGEVFFYRTPGPGRKKPIECEVTAVFKVSKKCNLKNMNDGTLYKSVEWSKLQQQE